jgi:hypothetical protein
MPVFCFKISLFTLPRAQLWYTCGSSSSDKASRASLQKGDDSYAHNSIGFSGSLEGTYVEPCHPQKELRIHRTFTVHYSD